MSPELPNWNDLITMTSDSNRAIAIQLYGIAEQLQFIGTQLEELNSKEDDK